MRDRALPGLALLAVLFSALAARADEIRLKDGSKISGTIVGFESDSFRVETSYGFALIRKDKVADINITAPKKESEPKTKSNAQPAPIPTAPTPSAPSAASAPEVAPAVEKEPASPTKAASEANRRCVQPWQWQRAVFPATRSWKWIALLTFRLG